MGFFINRIWIVSGQHWRRLTVGKVDHLAKEIGNGGPHVLGRIQTLLLEQILRWALDILQGICRIWSAGLRVIWILSLQVHHQIQWGVIPQILLQLIRIFLKDMEKSGVKFEFWCSIARGSSDRACTWSRRPKLFEVRGPLKKSI